jgi:hypothetical protein
MAASVETLRLDRHTAGRPEADLVVQCARTLLSGASQVSLQEALTGPHNWPALEHWADYHAMVPLVAFVLNEYLGECVPHEVRDRLKKRSIVVARNNLRQMQEWHRVLDLLQTAATPVISIKGPALALLAYQCVALREFRDLDLLVRPVDVTGVCDILTSSGYQLRSPLPGNRDGDLTRSPNRQLKFVNVENGTVVELHWDVLPAMLPFQLPVDLLFESARREWEDGISFLSLSREHLLLFLCAHGTKHCWMRLHWLCDLSCYIHRFPDLDWELCVRQAETMSCGSVLTHSLLLAQRVLGLALPQAIDKQVREDPKSKRMADMALRFLFSREGGVGEYAILRYYLAFAKNLRDQLHVVFHRIFVPDTPEWEAVRLPDSLSFLYYCVRPLRFMLHRLSNRVPESSPPTTPVYAGHTTLDGDRSR